MTFYKIYDNTIGYFVNLRGKEDFQTDSEVKEAIRELMREPNGALSVNNFVVIEYDVATLAVLSTIKAGNWYDSH